MLHYRPPGLLLGILILLPISVLAQPATISGTVRDLQGVPLPGVNVFISGSRLGAATDVAGRYRISEIPPGTYVLQATAVGFRREQREISAAPGTALVEDFILQEITVQSGEVIVTASRRAQLSGSVPMSMSTMSARDLDVRNVVTLDDALRYIPGVQMAGNQVNIRGSSGFSYNAGSRVLLLVDGFPMLRPDADGVAFDAVPATQIERIEVFKGPGSALYGGGALGGVINIITRNFPDRPQTSARVYGGAYQPVRYDVWRSKWSQADQLRPLGGATLSHARQLSRDFGFWTSLAYHRDTGHLRLNKRMTVQGFAKAGWRIRPQFRFDLLTGVTRRQSDNFAYWNGARDALNPGVLSFGEATSIGSDDHRTYEMSVLPTLTHVPSSRFYYSLKGRLFGVVIQPLDEKLRPKPVSQGTTGFRYGGEVQVNWTPRPDRYLTAGVAADANATRSSFFENVLRSQPESAVFAQWEQSLGSVAVVAGLRYDMYRIRAGHVERKLSPKVNASIALGDLTTLRAAYGQGFRVPSIAERYIDNRDYFPIVANIDLEPETSTSYEVGGRRLIPLPFGGLHLDLAAFWNEYWKLVEPMFVPAEQAFQFVNLTRARVRGLEAALDAVSVGEHLALRAGYTFLDADDLSTDLPLVFRSQHLLKTSASIRFAGAFEAGLDYRLASRPERIDSDFSRFVPDAEIMVPMRVFDARLGARWRSLRATLMAKNLLDYYYLERPALLAPPRHFVLQLQADL